MIGETLILAVVSPLLVVLGLKELRAWLRQRFRSPLDDDHGGGNGNGNGEVPASKLKRRLEAAGLEIDPASYVLATLLVAGLAFLLVLEIAPGAVAEAAVVASVIAYAVVSIVRDIAAWRIHRFEAELVDTVDLIATALQSGENLPQAIASAASVSRGAVKTELARVVGRLEFGVPIDRALARIVRIYDSEGVRLFAHTLIAKWQAGGDVAPVLRSVNRLLREQVKLRMHLQSQLAGARLSALFVAFIPYILVPVFLLREPRFVDVLLHHPIGPTLLFAAVALQLVGFLWIRKLLRIQL